MLLAVLTQHRRRLVRDMIGTIVVAAWMLPEVLIPKGKPYNMSASNAQVLLVNAPALDKSGDSSA